MSTAQKVPFKQTFDIKNLSWAWGGFGHAAREVSNPANAKGQAQIPAQIMGEKHPESIQLGVGGVLLSHQRGSLAAVLGTLTSPPNGSGASPATSKGRQPHNEIWH